MQEVTGIDLEPFMRAQEMLTGAAVIPVSVVGPIELELGDYELREPAGELVETGRIPESLEIPVGAQLQTPPAYSAVKVGGRRAYDLARAGE